MFNEKVRAVVRLFRPELPFAAGICVVMGEIIALGKFAPIRELSLGFLCGFFISGSAIVLNDYFDLEVDRVNTPDRPLPMGSISPSEAILLAVIAILIGLAASLWISVPAFILCSLLSLISFLYNWKFKEAGILGNLMVSSSVAITFILGGLAVGENWNRIVWTFGLMAFFVDLGEEVAGDAMDIEGDKKRNSQSIAILHGRNFALKVSSSCFGLVILIGFLPVIFGWLGLSYLLVILMTDVLIVAFTLGLWKSKTPEEGRRFMRGIYLGALLGALAFLLGKMFARF